MCVLIFSTTFVWNILTRIHQDTVTHVRRSSCRVPVTIARLQTNVNLLDIFSKNICLSHCTKIRPVGAELFHADGRTDMTKLTVAFRNFSNAPKSPQNARNFCQLIYIMTLGYICCAAVTTVMARKMNHPSKVKTVHICTTITNIPRR